MSVFARNLSIGPGEHPIDVRLTDAALDLLTRLPRGNHGFDLDEHRALLTTITLTKIACREKIEGFVVIEAADLDSLLASRREHV